MAAGRPRILVWGGLTAGGLIALTVLILLMLSVFSGVQNVLHDCGMDPPSCADPADSADAVDSVLPGQ